MKKVFLASLLALLVLSARPAPAYACDSWICLGEVFGWTDVAKVHADRDVKKAELDKQKADIDRQRELVHLAHDTDCTCEICVAMPHEPIICCICDKPIEGDDLDDRFWLHEKGCQFGHTGLCECDLECHAACYAGHEDEYAPLFDDEEDDTDEGAQP